MTVYHPVVIYDDAQGRPHYVWFAPTAQAPTRLPAGYQTAVDMARAAQGQNIRLEVRRGGVEGPSAYTMRLRS